MAILRRKKAAVFKKINKLWSLAWAHNWNSIKDMLSQPQKSADRIARRTRLRDDDYTVPVFGEASVSPDYVQGHMREIMDRADQAMMTGILRMAELEAVVKEGKSRPSRLPVEKLYSGVS